MEGFKKGHNGFIYSIILALLLSAFFFWDIVFAAVPREIFLQAKVTTTTGMNVSGPHNFTFRLYSAETGGSDLWQEIQSLTPDNSGIISCYLGSSTAFPGTLDFNSLYYLSIEMDSDGEMSPRLKIVSSASALNSDRFDGLTSSQFLRSDIADTKSATLTFSGVETDITAAAGEDLRINAGGAASLVNIFTGNLKVGDGAPTYALGGKNAYIEGTLEVGGYTYGSNLLLSAAYHQAGMAAPGVSAGGTGSIYFDLATNKFKASENGGAYVDLVYAGLIGDITDIGDVNSGAAFTAGGTQGSKLYFYDAVSTNRGQLTVTNLAGGPQTYTLPNATGEISVLGQTIENGEITNSTMTISKLANVAASQVLTTTAGGVPQWENKSNFASSSLADTHIYVGNGLGVATDVPMGGDVNIANTGVTTIQNNAVTTAKIADNNVTLAKIADGAANQVLTTDALNNPQWENKGIFSSSSLADTHIYVGNGVGVATDVPMGGDINIANTGITTIQNGAVTTPKIADSNVTTLKIADSNVTTTKIADNNVTLAKIADGAANQVLTTDALNNPQWENKSIFASSILTDAHIYVGSGANVATDLPMGGDVHIDNAGVTTIQNNAVTTVKIADSNVTTLKIADSNVTTVKIADNNVTLAKIADGAANQVLTTDALNNPQWENKSIFPSSSLADGHIYVGSALGVATDVPMGGDINIINTGAASIVNNAVTTAKIADNNVTLAKIVDGGANQVLITDGAGNPAWTAQGIFSSASGWFDNGERVNLVTNADNVGIGTSSALDAKLGVVANGSQTGYALRIQDASGADKVAILDKGNVGIGTTAPAEKLVVAGNIVGDTMYQGTFRVLDTNTTFAGDVTGPYNNLKLKASSVKRVALDSTGAPADGDILSWNNVAGQFQWIASPIGTITQVGDVLTGAAFTALGTQGTSLWFYDADGRGQLTIANLTAPRTYTLPDAGGEISLLGQTIENGEITNSTINIGKLANAAATQVLTTTAGGVPQWENKSIFAASSLTDGHIYVGSALGVATDVPMGGDINIINTGAASIVNNAVTTAKIADNNVTLAKIADGAANQVLTTDALNNPQWENKSIFPSSSLADGHIYVGSALGVATDVPMGGDINIINTGAASIVNNAVTTTKIADNNVTLAKIVDGGANQVLITDGAGNPAWIGQSIFSSTSGWFDNGERVNLVTNADNVGIGTSSALDAKLGVMANGSQTGYALRIQDASGADKVAILDKGNVGIGTTAPRQKLEVSGTALVSNLQVGTSATAGFILTADASGVATWQDAASVAMPAGGAGQTLRHTGAVWVANSVLFNNGTNVGIGSAAPAEKLVVAGNIVGDTMYQGTFRVLDTNTTFAGDVTGPYNNLKLKASSVKRVALDSTGAPADGDILSWNNVAGQFQWIASPIGTITQVGDVLSGAAFTALGTQGTSLWFYDADGRGQLTIANLTAPRTYTLPDAGGEISLLGQTIENGEITNSTINIGKLANAAATQVLTTTAGGVPQWENKSIFPSSSLADGHIYVGSALGVATDVPMGGDINIINTGAASIVNNAVTTTKIADNNVTLAKIVDGGANQVLITDGAGNPAWIGQSIFSSTSGWFDNGERVNLVTNADNVGIGTSSALDAKLGVMANGSQTGYALRIQDASGADKVAILDKGNVGIGTTAPRQRLEVSGTALVSNLQVGTLAIAGYILTADASGVGTWQDAASVAMPAGGAGQTLRHDGSAWVANSILFNNGTNVGIGSAAPAEKLVVAGNIVGDTMYQGTFRVLDTNTTFAGDVTGPYNNLKLKASSVKRVALDSTGAPADGDILSWNNVAGQFQWIASPIGTITQVGDVLSGAAFTALGTQGTSLWFYDADGRGQLTIANLTAPRTYTLPDAGGEISLLGQTIENGEITNSTINIGKLANAAATQVLTTTAGGVPQWENKSIFAASSLTDGHIYVGSALGVATDVPMGGDINIINTGAASIVNNAVTTTKIADNNVTLAKIVDGGANQVLITDGAGNPAWIGQSIFSSTSGWFDNGERVNLVTNADNVGIGTSSALDAKLGVMANGSQTGYALRIQDASGADKVAILDKGNVGIGTTAPRQKLEVSGTALVNNLQVGTSATAGFILTADASGVGTWQNAASVAMPAGGAGQTLRHDGSAWVANSILFNNGTNVGIGSAAPAEKLVVAGNIIGDTMYQGTFRVLDTNTTFAGDVTGPYNNLKLKASSVKRVALDSTGAPADGDILSWNNGAGQFEWRASSIGTITQVGDVLSGAAFTALGTQGTSLWFYDADGRGQLTIANLTAPRTYTLPDAGGEISLLGQTIETAEITNLAVTLPKMATGPADQLLITDGAGAPAWTSQGLIGGYGGWKDDGDIVRLITNADNIGIGISSPLNAKVGIKANGSDTGYALRIQDAAGAEKVAILDKGNVGIGTTAPTEKLVVAGNIVGDTMYQGTFRVLDTNTTFAGDVTGPYNNLQLVPDAVGTPEIANLAVTNAKIANTTITEAKIAGTSPNMMLVTNGAGNAAWMLQSGMLPDNSGWHDDGISVRLVSSNDNVGIGTSTPQAKLEIVSGSTIPLRINGYNFPSSTGSTGQVLKLMAADTLDWSGSAGIPSAAGLVHQLQRNFPSGTMSGTPLLVYDDTTNDVAIGVGATNNAAKLYIRGSGTTVGLALRIADSAGTDRLAVLDKGNVGIGTTAPTEKLVVIGNIAGTTMYQGGFQVLDTNTTFAGDVTGPYNNLQLVADAVGTIEIANLAVTNAKIANTTITEAKIAGTSPNMMLVTNGAGTAAWMLQSGMLPDNSGWHDDGISVRLVSSNDNVGIGTSTPQAKLEIVSGSTIPLRINGYNFPSSTGSTGQVLKLMAADTLDWSGSAGIPSAAGLVHQLQRNFPSGTMSGTPLMVYDDTTNDVAIGVGTTNNAAKLYVRASGTTLGFALRIADSAVTDRLVVLDNGNVGIGTTKPSSMLEIAGTIPAITDVQLVKINPNLTETASYQQGVYINSSAYPNAASNAFLVGTKSVLYSSSANLAAANLVGLQSSIMFWGAGGPKTVDQATAGYFRNYANDVDATFNKSYGVYIANPDSTGTIVRNYGLFIENQTGGDTDNYAIFSAGGTNYMSGNVGIGTSIPRQKLDVNGTALVSTLQVGTSATSGFVLTADASGVATWQSLVGVGVTGVAAGGVHQIQRNYPAGTLAGTPLMVYDDTTNSLAIGVGTTNNAARLYIKGIGTTLGFALRIADSTPTDRLVVLDNGNVGVGTTQPLGLLQVGTSPTTNGLLVTTYGNVGIGTSRPRQRLEVNATALVSTLQVGTSATTGQVLTADASGVATWQAAPSGADASGWHDDGSDVRLVTNADNIDLGTSSPLSAKLGIKANGSDTGFALRLQDAKGTDKVTILDNGTVGIGTTAPDELLTLYKSENAETSLKVSNLTNDTQAAAGITVESATSSGGLVASPSNAIGGGTPNLANRLAVAAAIGSGLDLIAMNAAADMRFYSGGFATANERMRIISNGNVGIGTSTPRQKLEVAGTATVSTLQVGTSATNGFVLTTDASGVGTWQNAASVAMPAGSSGQTLRHNGANWVANNLIFNNGTNVGIGTTNVSVATLVVDGNAVNATDAATVLVEGTLDMTNSYEQSLYVSPTVNPGGASTTSYSGIRSVPSVSGNSNLVNANIVGLDGEVWMGAGGVIRTLGSAVAGNFKIWAGDANARITDAYGVLIEPPDYTGVVTNNYGLYISDQTGATHSFNLYSAGANTKNYFVGNIGIGTSSPQAPLEIVSPSLVPIRLNGYNFPTGTGATGQVLQLSSPSTLAWTGIGGGAANAGGVVNQMQVNNPSGTLGGTPLMVYDVTTNNVAIGVGVTNIAGRLYVRGAGTTLGFALRIADSTPTDRLVVLDNGNVGMGTTAPLGWLQIGTSPSPALLVTGLSNVGIGTTAARQRLDVNGTALVSTLQVGTSATNGFVLTTDASGVGTWQNAASVAMPAGSAGQTLRHNGANWVANSVLYNNGTNIGIGTTAPSAKLEINGAVGIGSTNPSGMLDVNGRAYFRNANAITLALDGSEIGWIDGAAGGIKIQTALNCDIKFIDSNNKEMVVIENNTGNVGIGETNVAPTARLKIQGSGIGTAFAFRISDSLARDRLVVLDNGNVGMGTTSPLGWLQIGTSPSPALLVTGLSNVGIGTTAARQRLDVNGTALVSTLQVGTSATSGFVLTTDASGVATWQSLVGVGVTGVAAGGVHQIQRNYPLGTLAGTPLLVYDDTANSVAIGVGTTNNASRLYIKGIGTTLGFALRIADSTPTDRLVVMDNGNVGIGTTAPLGWLQIGTSPSPALLVTGLSNVGIGTTAARQRLDVNGTALVSTLQVGTSATSGFVLTTDASGVGTWQNAASVAMPAGSNGQTLRYNGANWVANSLLYNNGTNVGIGTTNPLYRVHIAGTGTVNGLGIGNQGLLADDGSTFAYFTNTGAFGSSLLLGTYAQITVAGGAKASMYAERFDSFVDLVIGDNNAYSIVIGRDALNIGIGATAPFTKFNILGNGTGTNFAFRVADKTPTDRFVVLDNGNVGIGTTAPRGLLQVGTAPTVPALLVTAYNNVGIGTSVPRQRLEVNGTALVSSLQVGTSATNGFVLTADASGVGTWQSLVGVGVTGVAAGGLHQIQRNYPLGTLAGTPLLVYDDTANSVAIGVGTTNNASRLYIKGIGTTLGFALRIADSTPTDRLVVMDNGNVGMGTTAPLGWLQIGTSPSPALLVTGLSNVGIGTTAARQRLDVNGTALVSSLQVGTSATAGFILTADASGVGTWQNAASVAMPAGSSGQTLRYSGANWVANYQLFNNGTNIGIGTTMPMASLDIDQRGSIAGAIRLNYNVATQSGDYTILRTDSGGIFEIIPSASSVYVGGDLVRSGASGETFTIFSNSGGGAIIKNADIGTAPQYKTLQVRAVANQQGNLTEWQNSGSAAIDVVDINGNLGIGITAPTARLEIVSGSTIPLRVNGYNFPTGTGATGQVLQLSSPGTLAWNGIGGGAANAGGIVNQMQVNNPSGTLGGTPLMVYDVTTNNVAVGVGVTNIAGRLYVRGAGTTLGFALRIADSTPTDRLVVLDNGNVGMGTTAPLGWLQVGSSPSPALLVTGLSNVGIGTTAARQRLDVNGTALVSTLQVGTSTTAGYLLTADASGVGTWQVAPSGADASGWHDDGTTVRLVATTDNVGIGVSGTLAGKLSIQGAGTTAGFALRIADSAGTDRLVVLDNGNVGIGTTSPENVKFKVVQNNNAYYTARFLGTGGEISISGAGSDIYVGASDGQVQADNFVAFSTNTLLEVSAKGTGDLALQTQSTGNVGIGTSVPIGLLQVGTSPSPGLFVTRGGSNVGIGTTAARQRLDVNGTALVSSLQVGTSATSGFVLTTDASGVGTWQNAASVAMPAGSAGQTLRHNGTSWVANSLLYNNGTNIGIGTTVPTNRLDVEGLFVVDTVNSKVGVGTTDTYFNETFGVDGSIWTSSGIVLGAEATILPQGGTNLNFLSTDTTGTFLGSTYFTGGNVGIGTTAPQARLEIVSGSTLPLRVNGYNFPTGTGSTGQVLQLSSPSTLAWTGIGGGAANAGGSVNQMQVNNNGTLAGTPLMVYDLNTNNVAIGVGVTNIAGRLYVRGAGTTLGFALRIADSTPTDRLVVLDNGNVGMGTTAPLGWLQVGTSPSPALLVTGLSNVGIGTTAARQRLDVNGTALVSTLQVGTSATSGFVLTTDASGVGTWQAVSGTVPSGSAGQTLRNNGAGWVANYFLYNDGTNIGLGTTAPQARLHINQNLSLSGIQLDYDGSSSVTFFAENGGALAINPGGSMFDMGGDIRRAGFSGETLSISSATGGGAIIQNSPTGTAPAYRTLIVEAVSGQRGNLTEWQDSSTAPLAVLTVGGNLGIGATAPAVKLEIAGGSVTPLKLNGYNFPATTGSTGQVLQLSSPSTLAWNGLGGGAANAGGQVNQMQVNNPSGTLGGTPLMVYDVTTDNVAIGVGTTNISGRLYVRGAGTTLGFALRIADSTPTDRLVVLDNGNVGIGTTRPLGWLQIGTSPSPALLVTGLSNVGIGTTAARQRLDVNGTALVSSLQVGTSATSGFVLTTDASGVGTWQNAASVAMPAGSSGQTLRHNGANWVANSVLYNNGTNIGIGTTYPQAPLHINQNSTIYGINLEYAPGQVASINAGNGGELDMAPAAGQPINVGGELWRSGSSGETLRITSATGGGAIIQTAPAGTAPAYRTLIVEAVSGQRGNLTEWQDSSAVGLAAVTVGGNFGIGTTAPFGLLQVGTAPGNPGLFVRAGGSNNVGIGTTGPRQRLDVNGTALVSTLQVGTSATSGFVLTTDASGVGTWQSLVGVGVTGVAAGGLHQIQRNYPLGTLAGTPLMVYDDTANSLAIGVGTTNNASRLYIKGIGTTLGFALRIADSTPTDRLVVLDNGNVGMGTTVPLGWLQIGTSPSPALLVTGLSNVGIGTTAARQRLDVNGTALVSTLQVGTSATSGFVLATDASGVGTWQNAASVAMPSGSTGQTLRYSGAAWVANYQLYNNGTNIGMGITAPEEALHVVGNIKLTGVIKQGTADVAELMPLSKTVLLTQERPLPADVVIIDRDNGGVMRSYFASSPWVLGIVSTNPAQILKEELKDAVAVALSGTVPCKVTNENGPIQRGDLLVSSSRPGYAMKAPENPKPGTIIAKALEPSEKDMDVITVLVMLR